MDETKESNRVPENTESESEESVEMPADAAMGGQETVGHAGSEPEEETTESFAELLAASGEQPKAVWRKGDKVAAKVVAVTDEWVFVTLGGKQEGTIRIQEFAHSKEEGEAGAEAEAAPAPTVGDEVQAYVLSTGGGEIVLTTQLGRRDASLASLEEAWRNQIPVEGRLVKTVKGGYEVRIGAVRAFCPLSQIDLRWPKEAQAYVSQTYSFRIIEFKENGRNIVVSRRALLEEEREKQREELRQALQPGEVVTGTVRSTQKFGAFVDIGGVDALIPISEMSWGRVEDPTSVVKEGQQISAKVLNVDWEKDRISLSLKAMAGDPWEGVEERYRPGEKVAGKVVRLAGFGAFVNLEPGIDGLVHISALGAGRRVSHPKDVVSVGEQVEVEVVGVDAANRKISLSLEHRFYDSLGDLPSPGQTLTGTVEKVADFGVFVKLPSGHTGLVPNAEMATERGADHRSLFKPGDEMPVQVLAVEQDGKRIRLSRKAVLRQEETAVVQSYAAPEGDSGGSLGTLGDLLKDKLGRK